VTKIPIHCQFKKILTQAELKPYPNNAARHSVKQIKLLAQNITELGWRHPITVSNQSGFIVYGHARLKAAELLNCNEIPVEYQDYKTPEIERTSRLSDNRIAELATTDIDKLKTELIDIKSSGNKLDLIGYSDTEINRIIKIDEDKLIENLNEKKKKEIAEKWKVKTGTLYKLGEHYLICGDATNKDIVDRLFKYGQPNLMVTDPPYGINYDQSWQLGIKSIKCLGNGENLSLSNAKNDNNADWSKAYQHFKGNVAYIWSPTVMKQKLEFIKSIMDTGFVIRSEIVWYKTGGMFSRCQYKPQHEICFYSIKEGLESDTNYNYDKNCPYADSNEFCMYCVKDGQTSNWQADNRERSVWIFDSLRHNKDKTGHSNQKPLECYIRPIVNSSKENEYIYDPFCGSGTSIISCEKTKRKCLAVELSEDYIALTLERYKTLTNIDPVIIQ